MKVYEIFRSMWRNYPQHASTFSNCECGRGIRRGGELCVTCLIEKLTKTGQVSVLVAQNYLNLICEIRAIERATAAVIGEDVEI